MSDLIRVQVFYKKPADVPRDGFSNTFYFRAGTVLDPPSYEDTAEAVRDIYSSAMMAGHSGMQYDIRAYKADEPPHTPPRARITGSFPGSLRALMPREVALCLSYRTDPPYTSRRRGRVYIGPIEAIYATERPTSQLRDHLIDFGEALAGVGGEDVSWRMYSPTNSEDHHIRHIWVDDSWDTIRGRGQAPTTRSSADV